MNVNGVKIVGLGVVRDGCYEDGSAGEILDEINWWNTAESEIPSGTGDTALNCKAEQRVDESVFVKSGEDGVVDFLGRTVVGGGTVEDLVLVFLISITYLLLREGNLHSRICHTN